MSLKESRCVCGHIKDDHSIGPISGIPVCDECRILGYLNDFHIFRMNNLDYIEKRYDERLR